MMTIKMRRLDTSFSQTSKKKRKNQENNQSKHKKENNNSRIFVRSLFRSTLSFSWNKEMEHKDRSSLLEQG